MSIRQILLASAAMAFWAGGAQAFTLHILHINDAHSRIESINKYDSTCSAEDEAEGACFGGVARLVTAVNEIRAEAEAAGEPVILLSAGDQFSGSLFFTTYQGQAEAEFMNAIGFDAMVLGNHEFDLGTEPLAAFIKAVEFPVAYGNTDATGDEFMADLNPDPVILEVDGHRIGIVGAVAPETAEISSPGDGIVFTDTVETMSRHIEELQADGVDHIIGLTHVGVTSDLEIASQVAGLDILIGGHSHTLFSNTVEDAPYEYPHMVEGPEGYQTPVVQAGAYTKYLGHATPTFDDEGNVTEFTGDTMLLDASVEPDAATLERVAEMAGPIEELKSRRVGETSTLIDGSRDTCRAMECTMGNLVADAMLDRVKDQGVTIAVQNGGGLRASIEAGTVTMGDVLTVLPFQNTLSTFDIKGAALVEALENGVSQVEEGGGRFPQVSGMKYSWTAEAAPMEGRIREVLVQEGDEWVPIDPEKVYSVVTNNFMRGGGDGYVAFRDEGSNAYDYGPGLEEVVAEYLAGNAAYEPYTDGRITKVE